MKSLCTGAKWIALCLVFENIKSLGVAADEPPQEIRVCLEQSTIAENNSLSGPEPCVRVLMEYMRSNWRSVLDDLDAIAATERQKSVLMRAGESLDPEDYLELLRRVRDLRVASRISSRVFDDAIIAGEYKEGFLAFNYQRLEVREFVESLRPLRPPERQEGLDNILSGKAKERIERRWAAERTGEVGPSLLLPTPVASVARSNQMAADPKSTESVPSAAATDRAATAVAIPERRVAWAWIAGAVGLVAIALLIWKRRR